MQLGNERTSRSGVEKASSEALENAETFERIPDSLHQLGDSFERVADSIQRVANSRKQVPDSFTRTGVLVSKLATLVKEFPILYMNSGRLCKEFPILCKVLATLSKEFAFSYVFSAFEAPFAGLATDQRCGKWLFTPRSVFSRIIFRSGSTS